MDEPEFRREQSVRKYILLLTLFFEITPFLDLEIFLRNMTQ
jgi:hypothetical protein